MRSRGWSAFGLITTLGAGAGSAYFLHRLGSHEWLVVDWQHPGRWLDTVPIDWAVAAAARLLGLGLSYWLVVSGSLYVLARLVRLPAAIRGVGWVTLPGVRRLADRVVMTGLAAASFVAPAPLWAHAAANDAATTTTVTIAPGYVPVPAGRTTTAGPTDTTVPPAPSVDAPAVTSRSDSSALVKAVVKLPAEVTVARGDHLWLISERHLAAAWGRPAADHEIAPYWLKVIEANRSQLRSGNPDLIYPGEVILLPTI